MIIILIIVLFSIWGMMWFWWRWHWQDGLFVTVTFSTKRIFQGEKLVLTQHIYNHKRLPLHFVQVMLPVPRAFRLVVGQGDGDYLGNLNQVYSLNGYENRERTLNVQMAKRGIYTLSEIELESRELVTGQVQQHKYPIQQEIIVYPHWLDVNQIQQHWESSLGETLTRFSLFEDPLLFRGVREMQPQDALKQVNWKKTATTGTFYVNQYEPVSQRQLTLVLALPDEASWRTEKYAEATISLFATIAHECLAAGWQLKVLSNACNRQGEPFMMTQLTSMAVVLDACAAIDLEQTTNSESLFTNLLASSEQHVVVCASAAARQLPFLPQLQAALGDQLLWLNMVDHFRADTTTLATAVKEVLLP